MTSIVRGAEKMRIDTEEVGTSQRCRPGRGLRRVSFRADELGVPHSGLQYAVTRDPRSSATRPLMPSDRPGRFSGRGVLLQHFGIETPIDFALLGWVTIGLECGDQSAQSRG